MSRISGLAKWSEMAPLMKFLVVHTSVMITMSAAVMFFLVLPAIKTKASLATQSAAVGDTFNKTHAKIASMGVQRETTLAAEEKLETLVDSGVLVPLLGSLEMRAMAILTPLTAATGVTIAGDSVKSMTPRPIQDPKSISGRVYARQPIEFSGSGTFTQIADFVHEVEEKLPMVTLHSLRIVSQSRSPEVHAMTMAFEWPVGVENKTGKDDKLQGTAGLAK